MNSLPWQLEFGTDLWDALIADLRTRGKGRRESGAFILGELRGSSRVSIDFIPYEELDPRAQHYAYVRLGTDAFSRLWEECSKRHLQVIADVHTHPCGPRQSSSDRDNPMISLAGHVALIVPNFAHGSVTPADVSVNVYHGQGRWTTHLDTEAAKLLTIKRT